MATMHFVLASSGECLLRDERGVKERFGDPAIRVALTNGDEHIIFSAPGIEFELRETHLAITQMVQGRGKTLLRAYGAWAYVETVSYYRPVAYGSALPIS